MFRYISAGLISVAMHFFIFAPLFDQPAMAFPVNQQSQSVSLRFSAVTKSLPKKTDLQSEHVKAATPTPLEKVVPKAVKTKRLSKTTKKRIVKEKTKTEKIAKKAPKTALKKEILKKVVKVEKKPASVEKTKKLEKSQDKPTAAETPPLLEATAAVSAKKISPTENETDNKHQVSEQKNGLQDKPQLIEKSRFLSKPNAPKYPRMAKRKGIEGTVTYEVWLDEKGKQVKLLLKNSSGAKVLDIAALKAIKTWKFSPHSINGKKIAHRIFVPISFQLD